MKLNSKILLGIVGAGLAYEYYALRTEEEGDTISEIVWAASKRPLFPFTMGLLMGHFFWQRSEKTTIKAEVSVSSTSAPQSPSPSPGLIPAASA